MSTENSDPEDTGPTLEQLASEFKVQQTQPAQREPVATQPPKFESPEDYQNWSANQIATVSSKLNSVTEELDAKTNQEYIETQDKAVNKAIETIKKDVDVPDVFVEGMLHVKYARDANFRKIFDNRELNPAAYERALGVVARDLKNESQWRPDDQLAENSRAMKDLQKSANRGARVENPNERYKEMSASDFDREWERLKHG